MSEDAELKSQVSAEFSESITESVGILKNVIADLKQRLTAATARAEQAEAALAVIHIAAEGVRKAKQEPTNHRAIAGAFDGLVASVEYALSSESGKSTADELRLLRAANERFANIARGILSGNEREIDSFLRRDCEEVLAIYQPARAERSDS